MNEITKANNETQQSVSYKYEQYKRDKIELWENNSSRTEIIEELKKNEESIGKYLNLHGDFTEGNLVDCISNHDIQDLLKDIKSSNEKSYLGLYVLEEIAKNAKKYCNGDFFIWAETTTDISPYSLQSIKLDEILDKYIDGVYDKQNEKNIIKIAEKNASPNSLKIFDKLMLSFVNEMTGYDDDKKGVFTSEQKWIQNKKRKMESVLENASEILESMKNIVQHHNENKSFYFYYKMNPEYIEGILKHAKKIQDIYDENNFRDSSIKSVEPLIKELISYYVSALKNYSDEETHNININSELEKVFQIAFEYSKNKNLQEKILASYDPKNPYLPFLPFELIEPVLSSNAENKLKLVIAFFKGRYELTDENECQKIQTLNDKIINDKDKPIEIRKEAFIWYYESKKAERKEGWCEDIFSRFVNQNLEDSVQGSSSFVIIMEKCFETIKDEQRVFDKFSTSIVEGKNEYVINKIFDHINKKYNTMISDLSESNHRLAWDCVKSVSKIYSANKYYEDTKNFLIACIKNKKLAETEEVVFNKINYEIENEEMRKRFIQDVVKKLYSETDDKAFKQFLTDKYFEKELYKTDDLDKSEIVNFLWDNRENNVEKDIEAIIKTKDEGLIKCAIRKGWKDGNFN